MTKVKPCPFCGFDIWAEDKNNEVFSHPVTDDCYLSGQIIIDMSVEDEGESQIKQWNKRAK